MGESESENQPEWSMVHVRLKAETKRKWENAVEDSTQYSSLSDLIRTAVVNELSDDSKMQQPGGRDLVEINDRLERLENDHSRIGDLVEQLDSIEAKVGRDPELSELANEIFDVLPTKDDIDTWISSGDKIDYRPGEGAVHIGGSVLGEEKEAVTPVSDVPHAIESGRTEAIAEVVGESPFAVEKALEKLANETATVRKTDDNRYYKRVD